MSEFLNRDLLAEWGYEDCTIFSNPDYDSAIIGVSDDGQVIYDYDLMVHFLMNTDGMSAEEAMEFIDYNTIRALPFADYPAPIIMYRLK